MYPYNQIQEQKQNILVSNASPIQILIDIFKLLQDDFDTNSIHSKSPKLHSLLHAFCTNPVIEPSNISNECKELVKYVYENKELIRKYDIHLFYAVLGFLDYLKEKHILSIILSMK